ncbi:MAG: DEAD/DEAH box helicase [Armatimonadetes bacterium]|nr:DEAD/DEAH box helicase [Armatimonadota bacterium]
MSVSRPVLVLYEGSLRAVVRAAEDDFGIPAYDVVGLPRRLFAGRDTPPPLYETEVDPRRTQPWPSPATQLVQLAEGDTWLNMTMRSQGALAAWFLMAEDPQRRLDARRAATLTHQVSLVHHIITSPHLRRVLIADEVGLGKTIEAGLLIKQVLEEQPGCRVLYLSPARLVPNVVSEFREKLEMAPRSWVASTSVANGNRGSDARLDQDRLVVVSIHRAIHSANTDVVARSAPWDVVVVDECHHLSDWGPGGGKPNESYRLVENLVERLPPDGRLVLMSGTPHQGHQARFENILRLLLEPGESFAQVSGRVIYRIKDQIRDWRGKPLFPKRDVRPATIVRLGTAYDRWYQAVAALYETAPGGRTHTARASGWAKSQALQWVASSPQAGLGFLVRLAIRRLGWSPEHRSLASALRALRPYRNGDEDEPVEQLYQRLVRQIGLRSAPTRNRPPDWDVQQWDDAEDADEETWRPDGDALALLLEQGVELIRSPAGSGKWEQVERLLNEADGGKVVLFAQPVETVTVVRRYLGQRFGGRVAVIVGNQTEEERRAEVASFWEKDGSRFLVSSRAGGEGINLHCAHRLIHLDVPWNPMELEQRVGRIHRFGSRRTVVVDTVVVAGTREADAYRVAREKLRAIASNLDPERFEMLFSRVMSLVPPEELEAILGGAPPGPLSDSAIAEIGQLVKDGYEHWHQFDGQYRHQQEQIRALSPGTATWMDLSDYLVQFCGAKPAPDVGFQRFECEGDDVVAVDDAVPAILLGSTPYVCGDTAGMPISPVEGIQPRQLGLNLPEIAERMRRTVAPARPAGAAYLRLPSGVSLPHGMGSPFGVLGFVRQTLQSLQGRHTERGTTLHLFLVPAQGEPCEAQEDERAVMVRSLVRAVRQREPLGGRPEERLLQRLAITEAELWTQLRRPTEGDRSAGIRHAVWPIFAAIVS